MGSGELRSRGSESGGWNRRVGVRGVEVEGGWSWGVEVGGGGGVEGVGVGGLESGGWGRGL